MTPDQETVTALIRRYGRNAVPWQVIQPGIRYWFTADRQAVVAYVDSGLWWFAAGGPIAPPARVVEAALGFTRAAREAGRRPAFFGASERLRKSLAEAPEPYDWLQVGTVPVWDPRSWTQTATIRSQVRRALRKGVRVREVVAPTRELQPGAPLRRAAEKLVDKWLQSRPMPPLSYLVATDPFAYLEGHRFFVAEREDRLIGLLAGIPVGIRGWLLEQLICVREAPNGTSEALVDLAMENLRRDEVEYVTLGMTALAGLERARGSRHRHPFLHRTLQLCSRHLNFLYRFRGILTHRARLKPDRWEPVYLLAHPRVTAGTIWHLLKVFAGGRIGHFARATAIKTARNLAAPIPSKAWEQLAWWLAGLLVPWIGVLLKLDSQHWFGTPWLAGAWASFDAALALGFAALARAIRHGSGWGQKLAMVLLGAVLADTWLTFSQVLLYNAPRATAQEWLLLIPALCAPPFAACYLLALLELGPLASGSRREPFGNEDEASGR